MAKKTYLLILIFLIVVLLYYPILGVYFTGDDFFHFKVAQFQNLKEFIRFFGFFPFEIRGIAFYRPLFREVLYGIFYKIFGLNHLPFRVFQLILHLVNIALVYKLTQKLFDKKAISFFASLFFGITAANVGVLYYLAGGIQTQGATMFVLATLLLFLANKKGLSFLSFILSLASHELAIVILPLLVGLVLIYKKSLKQLWPFALVIFIYLYLNLKVIGFSESEIQYQPVLNIKKTINTLSWYFAWALGLPEMTVDFVKSGLSLDPRLMRYWGNYFRIIFPAFFISVITLLLLATYYFLQKRKTLLNKRFLFLLFWFPIALLPVLFLPWHKQTHYLAPALPAFWGAIGYLVFKANRKLLTTLLVLALLVLEISSVALGNKTYWAAKRGRIAKKLIQQIKSEYPDLPKGAIVYVKNDPDYPFIAKDWGGTSKQAYYILSGSDALQLLYKDSSLRVYYEDIEKPPSGLKEEVFIISAKI